jgi:hypothetical protein
LWIREVLVEDGRRVAHAAIANRKEGGRRRADPFVRHHDRRSAVRGPDELPLCGAFGGQRLCLPHRAYSRDITTSYGDQYYIKRLVGKPGDALEVVRGETKSSDGSSRLLASDTTGVLLRNGQPISGSEAFTRNNNREGLYRGYQAIERLVIR